MSHFKKNLTKYDFLWQTNPNIENTRSRGNDDLVDNSTQKNSKVLSLFEPPIQVSNKFLFLFYN